MDSREVSVANWMMLRNFRDFGKDRNPELPNFSNFPAFFHEFFFIGRI